MIAYETAFILPTNASNITTAGQIWNNPSNITAEAGFSNTDSFSTSNNPISDLEIRLGNNGTLIGDNKSSATQWADTQETFSYGGQFDMWGLTQDSDFTVEDINAGLLQVNMRAQEVIGGGAVSQRLRGSVFPIGFPVPLDATITGFEVQKSHQRVYDARGGTLIARIYWVKLKIYFTVPDAVPFQHQVDSKTSGPTNNDSPSVAKPLNLSEGNLILIKLHVIENKTVTALPTGFTLLNPDGITGDPDADSPQTFIYWKIAGASEPATYDFTISASAFWVMYAVRITEYDPDDIFGEVGSLNTGTSAVTTLEIPSVYSKRRTLLYAILGAASPVGTPKTYPSGMTERAAVSTSLLIASQPIPNAGQTGSRTYSWTTARRANGIMFTVNSIPTLPDPLFFGD